MDSYGELTNSIIRQIHKSRRPITILFTDIEDSTRYWDTHGDVKGRLILDQHNRLTFPVVHRFRGRIIKTIGDAIMASFKKPEDALKAAIGMQQALQDMRNKDRTFNLRVRIGVHTGQAIVEDRDVFGDVVNVAARVESKAKGNEILVSHATVSRLKKADFPLVKKGPYELKGKRGTTVLYRCEWEKYADLTGRVRFSNWLPVISRQKKELLLYLLASCGLGYFLYLKYLRYVIADSEELAVLSLNPGLLWMEYPWQSGIAAVVLLGLLVMLLRMRRLPHMLMHILKGGFGFGVLFVLAFVLLQNAPYSIGGYKLDFGRRADRILHESQHLFVEVLENNVPIYSGPMTSAETLMKLDGGHLLLLSDVATVSGYTWNKVLIAPQTYGWVQRVTPPRLGVPSQRLTWADKFYFRFRDLYAFLVALAGFVWGSLNFRIKPT